MADPSLSTAIAAALETAINGALKYDPGTRAQLQTIAGTQLNIHVSQPSLALQVYADQERLNVSCYCESKATTTLEGSLISIISLAGSLSGSSTSSLADSGVKVSGKVALLEQYQQLLKNLDIDWEDALSSVIGDLPAHQLALLGSSALGWLKQKTQRSPEFIRDFLTEELRAIPSKTELSHFSKSVNQVRQQTDRFEAKLQKISTQQQQQQQQQQQ